MTGRWRRAGAGMYEAIVLDADGTTHRLVVERWEQWWWAQMYTAGRLDRGSRQPTQAQARAVAERWAT